MRILLMIAVWLLSLGTPVVYAENDFFEVCARGNVADVQAALAGGADLAMPNSEGLRPLDMAVRHNTAEVIRLLLEAGADPNAESGSALPPLIDAVARGDDTILHALLQNGADSNWTDRDGVTALHRAALGTSKEVIGALLLAGANPAREDANKRTPVQYAAERGINSDVLEWLLFPAVPDELTLKLIADNAVLRDAPIGILLKEIQKVYSTYPQGLLDYCRSKQQSLLMLQARYAKSVQEIERFNWPSAFFGQTDILRQPALLYALKFNKNPEILTYFIEKTPVRPILSLQAETALMYAAKYVRDPAIVEQVLNKFCGRQKGATETDVKIQEIIAYAAGINKENKIEETALAFAVKYNSVEVVKLLLDNGASTNVKSILGKGLLFYAASNPDKAVSEFLVQKGFSITAMGRGQKTPALEAAWRNPNPEVVRYYMDLAMAEPHSPDLPQKALTLAARDNVSIDSIGALLAYGDEPEKEKILTVQRHLSDRKQDLDEFNRRYNPQRYGVIDSTQDSGNASNRNAVTEQDMPQNVSVQPYTQAATAEALQSLIDGGANIPFDENIPELHSQKAFGLLAHALREGNWDKARVMLQYCAKVPMDHLETYLLDQVFMNNSSIALRMLLQLKEYGFDIDAVDKAGNSLLCSLSAPTPNNFQGTAGKLSDLEAIRVMLWVGANAFQLNPDKIDAAELCLWDEDKKMPGMKYKELPEEIKFLMLY